MTSLTYQAAMQANPAQRERLGREAQEARVEQARVSFLERVLRFWDGLYADPMPTPRNYL